MYTLTEGKPYQSILRFMIPIMIGSLFQQFYNMADAFIISRTLGVEAFAGVSSTGGLSFLILGFSEGMTAGVAIPLAKKYGAKQYDEVKTQYMHNFLICFFTALILTIIATLSTTRLLGILHTPDDIFEYAYIYISTIFMGMCAQMLFNFFANTLRAIGNSKSPLHHLLIASFLNIFLDIVFISVLNLGVRGAALATIIAQLTSALLCYLKIRKDIDVLSLKDHHFSIQSSLVLDTLRIGIPMAFQSSIIALGVIFMQFATNGMGTIAVAAYAAAAKIDGIAVEPLRALDMTMSTYTAQNLGAQKKDRVRQGVSQSVTISILLSILLGIVMCLFGDAFVGIFVGFDQT